MTFKEAKKYFNYDPETGELTWRVSKGTAKAGSKAGWPNGKGYLRITFKGNKYMVHRVIWLWVHGYFPENQIDHVNRDRADNRLENLREVTASCNMKNRPEQSNNTSGVTGVCWYKGGNKWIAHIKVNSRNHHLGTFTDFREAVIARHKAEVKHGWPGCNHSTPAIRYLREN